MKLKAIACFAFIALTFPMRAQWVHWEISKGGNGHWYLAVPNTTGLNWELASAAAQAAGGYLATITSQAENDFVFTLINDQKFFATFNGSGPAIGGVQPEGSPEPDGGWSWVTGEPWGYTNWALGQPDNGNEQENRLHFYGGGPPAATWNDINAQDPNLGGYVAERDAYTNGPAAAINAAVEICWPTVTNRLYQVQWVDSLTSTNWVDLAAPILAPGSNTCVFDSTRGQQSRFYRILSLQ